MAWNPSMTTTEGWYDASDTSTITEAAGKVSQWDDKSGNARHMTQPTGINQLTTGIRTINALNVLDGDGVNEFIRNAAYPIAGGAGDLAVFAVAEGDFPQVNASASPFSMNAGGPDFKMIVNNVAQWDGRIQVASNPDATFAGGPFNGPSVYEAEFDFSGAGVVTGYVDGVARGVSTPGSYVNALLSPQDFTIMADKAAVWKLDGAIGEVIVTFDITTAERQLIEGYLAWKWGLEANLPADHPFKNIVPGTVLGNGGSGLSGAILAAMSTRGY